MVKSVLTQINSFCPPLDRESNDGIIMLLLLDGNHVQLHLLIDGREDQFYNED